MIDSVCLISDLISFVSSRQHHQNKAVGSTKLYIYIYLFISAKTWKVRFMEDPPELTNPNGVWMYVDFSETKGKTHQIKQILALLLMKLCNWAHTCSRI